MIPGYPLLAWVSRIIRSGVNPMPSGSTLREIGSQLLSINFDTVLEPGFNFGNYICRFSAIFSDPVMITEPLRLCSGMTRTSHFLLTS